MDKTQQTPTKTLAAQQPIADWAQECALTLQHFAAALDGAPLQLQENLGAIYERVQWMFANAPVPPDQAYHNLSPGRTTGTTIGKGT